MPVDVSKVLVGAPDQSTTGAIFDAPVGTKLPKAAGEALDAQFSSSGYVSDAGLSLSTDRSTKDIKDWSKATVRKILESFDSTVKWSEIQMSYESLCHAFGEANVTRAPATAAHGEQVSVSVGAALPPPRSWAFKMKDGASRMLVVVPNGQVTALDEMSFAADAPIALPMTLTCYPDAAGNSVYIYTDDGKVSS